MSIKTVDNCVICGKLREISHLACDDCKKEVINDFNLQQKKPNSLQSLKFWWKILRTMGK